VTRQHRPHAPTRTLDPARQQPGTGPEGAMRAPAQQERRTNSTP